MSGKAIWFRPMILWLWGSGFRGLQMLLLIV
jgi:hypothetical protein